MSFDTVLIANRGEIARRIIRTARSMGFTTVAVFSDADADAPHVREADMAVRIGPAPSAESYLVFERILDAARRTGAGAIHPGYGFLSENAAFAQACADAGIVFVGPTPDAIRAMGSKAEARKLMASHGVPVVPGSDTGEQTVEALIERASGVGFPLLVKASAGGGGKGMRVVTEESQLADAIAAAKREAMASFGDDMLILERYVTSPRHIEFQIMGDSHGNIVHVFERECSIQRRHQKIIEETPSVALSEELRAKMAEAAVAAGRALGYQSAGTVEFIIDGDGNFYFLEVNTRLQVEHPVTEMVTGLDLVALQLLVATGAPLPIRQEDIEPCGHAIECRIYAEDAAQGFLPATGTLADWHFADHDIRLDSGVEPGDTVSIHYDPMLAKLITHGATRDEANRKMIRALRGASIQGVTTNRDFLLQVLTHEGWISGDFDTHFIDAHLPVEVRGQGPDAEVVSRAAIAATLAGVLERDASRSVLPEIPRGWRNNDWRDTEQRFRDASDAEHEVRYRSAGGSSFVVTAGEAEPQDVRVLYASAPRLHLEIGGLIERFRVVTRGERVWVHSRAGSVRFDVLSRFPDADAEAVEGGCVAPMPGKVLDVLVDVGQSVEAGDALVILEAMKMEMTINAPSDGTVEELFVEVGQQVEAETLVVRLESA